MNKTSGVGQNQYELLQEIKKIPNKITGIKRPYQQPLSSTPEFLLQQSPRPGARNVRQRAYSTLLYTFGRSCSIGEDINFRTLIANRKTIAINGSKDFSVGSEYDLKALDGENLVVALESIVKRQKEEKSSDIMFIKLSNYFNLFEDKYPAKSKEFLEALTHQSGWENLQALDVGGLVLNKKIIPILEKVIRNNHWPALKALDLSSARFDIDQENYPYWLFVRNMFSRTQGMLLEELSIGKGFADDQTLTSIALAISTGILPNLKVLNLPAWHDGDSKEGLEQLLSALSIKKTSSLRALNLSGQNFSRDATQLFASAIRVDKFHELEILDLKDCNLDDASLATVINAFCDASKLSSLQCLNLEKNEFLMLSGQALARAVKEKKMPWLQEIYLEAQLNQADEYADVSASEMDFIKKFAAIAFAEESWFSSYMETPSFSEQEVSKAKQVDSVAVEDEIADSMQLELPPAYDALLEALCDHPLWRLQILSLKDLPISESVTQKVIENFFDSFLQLKFLALVRCDINKNHIEALQDKFAECGIVNFISKYDLYNHFMKMSDEEKTVISDALMSEFEAQLPYDDREIQVKN